ncbi:MAG TPA: class I SAM-dependent methyltransferase [Solirubrobacterales bacterium]|nr:class I SAM-dependent methyltransferase [Solirubrobacterales bacterium]
MTGARGAMRRTMFLSQDGVVLCATMKALDELGILEPSLTDERPLSELYPGLDEAGFGALRIALHCLASTGWLAEEATLDASTSVLRWTENGRVAAAARRHYVALGELLQGFGGAGDDAWTRPWSEAQGDRFAALVESARERWGIDPSAGEQLASVVRGHLDGGLTVPTMLWLHEAERLGGQAPDLPEGITGNAMRRLFEALGWLDPAAGTWTADGEQARAFALNFGGVATYLPMLARLPELYRGELIVSPPQDGGGEWHVHRELNLRISAAAHRRYFVDSDATVVELFDREPLSAQPAFIAEMGCGNGSWLIHLHELIGQRTRRGERLDEAPLLMVGVDIDATALEQARRRLDEANVPALLLRGDVTDPDGLCDSLGEQGLAIEDGLHIRSFIDHERSYRGADQSLPAPGWASGVYIDGEGRPLAGEEVERDLITHLARWERHARRHGMIVLEAHCVAPVVARKQLGALHSVAFDAHQAYSTQYPVDHASFLRCCQAAGLATLAHHERRYPSNRPFVSIGHNRLVSAEGLASLPGERSDGAPREDTWTPEPGTDLADGEALHEILFVDGDIRFPAAWGAGPTGYVVGGTLEAIEARLAAASSGETIRILDYGAGTGTASIELLKACGERGLEERLRRAGVGLELHLVDLPSSWFAKGHEVLRECAWTRFHSLRDPGGGFRDLAEATGGIHFDTAMVNMVFHLIPPKARDRAIDGLAETLSPAGRLLWSAPDLGPAGPYAVLLHDPNRALRERWLELLGGEGELPAGTSVELAEAVRRARTDFDEEALREAQSRADRRILPRPLAAEVVAALERRFAGETEVRTFEMLSEDIVHGLLVPSNQAEYLPEIEDARLRESVIRELMTADVIPRLQDGPAGTGLGLNLHWTLGAFSKRG